MKFFLQREALENSPSLGRGRKQEFPSEILTTLPLQSGCWLATITFCSGLILKKVVTHGSAGQQWWRALIGPNWTRVSLRFRIMDQERHIMMKHGGLWC